jgi:glycosyltransferase involved in cell wall biosynthesis
MPAASQDMTYLDLTRLCDRANSSSPSGIDRVDLTYARWLRDRSAVNYLAHSVAGFSHIDSRHAEAFLTSLETKWRMKSEEFSPAELRPLRDKAKLIRTASKWRARRAGLAALLDCRRLVDLCDPKIIDDLDLLDASAKIGAYRVDSAWRESSKRGAFFGISHSLLGRTAYMAALANHCELKCVFFIHDAIPCDYPEYCREFEGARHLLRLRNAFRYGTHLIVNSQYTKDRLEYWRLALGVSQVPVEVIPIGVDEQVKAQAANKLAGHMHGRPYFVTLGTIEPRKNHMLLLQIWKHFAETLSPNQIPELIIIGRRGWENETVFRMLDRCECRNGHVREINNISDDELWPLLRNARAMLYPSFVEGWGMPMSEALTMRVPVIASDIPSFREAGQGVPDLLSTLDGAAWSRLILDFAKERSLARSAQEDRLRGYAPPTWQEHFKKVSEFVGLDCPNDCA